MKEFRKRKSIRLRNYDYSQCGAYFITICTHGREWLFGKIENGIMICNEYGRIAAEEIVRTNELRKAADISISQYVIMPNHVHFIVEFVGTRLAVSDAPRYEEFAKPVSESLSSVVRSYKAAVTKHIREACGGHGKPCPYEIWQGRFYDHIIRNEDDYLKISEYIANNPAKWQEDRFYYNSDQQEK